jgi:HAD superfamily hydrolase (TIGR01490 family)
MSSGPAFAFFDVDETLISEKSMFTMLGEIGKAFAQIDVPRVRAMLDALGRQGASRAEINLAYYRSLAGLSQKNVQLLASSYVSGRLARAERASYLIRPVVEELQLLRSRGIAPVFLSGSARDFLLPLARELAVEDVLATQLEIDREGCYTGKTEAAPMVGEGKLQAMLHFAELHQAELRDCYGYGDHHSDLAYLTWVGHPHVVSGDVTLELHARRQGWRVIRKRSPVTLSRAER